MIHHFSAIMIKMWHVFAVSMLSLVSVEELCLYRKSGWVISLMVHKTVEKYHMVCFCFMGCLPQDLLSIQLKAPKESQVIHLPEKTLRNYQLRKAILWPIMLPKNNGSTIWQHWAGGSWGMGCSEKYQSRTPVRAWVWHCHENFMVNTLHRDKLNYRPHTAARTGSIKLSHQSDETHRWEGMSPHQLIARGIFSCTKPLVQIMSIETMYVLWLHCPSLDITSQPYHC